MMKFLSVLLIVILFVQVFVEAKSVGPLSQDDVGGKSGGLLKAYRPKKINCKFACSRRCSKSARKNVCSRACLSCCATCNCVPPGTYGNKGLCPCYAKLKTHGNRPKCP